MNQVIAVRNVWKRYQINFPNRFTEYLQYGFSKKHEFWALKGVNLYVAKGEIVGIVGSNGSGKSTVLKLISGITLPTKGSVSVSDWVVPILELGTGFHPELSGRENVYLNGSLLGLNKGEIFDKFNEIVEFSGIAKFIDTPVKHYSSGMYARLALAVGLHINPEILLIDEILGVGDIAFQNQTIEKIKEIKRRGTTVVFVSHNMNLVENFCDRVIVLEKGKILQANNVFKALNYYREQSASENIKKNSGFYKPKVKLSTYIEVNVSFFVDKKLVDDGFAIGLVVTFNGQNRLAQRNYYLDGVTATNTRFTVDISNLSKGEYNLTLNLTDKDVTQIYAIKDNFFRFKVR